MWSDLREWFFPSACLGCRAGRTALCARCAPQPAERQTFAVAGVRVVAAGAYDGLLRAAIVAMKHGERGYIDAFARIVAPLVPDGAVLVPLPTTRLRRAQRGFDQAVAIVRAVAALRGESWLDALVKTGAPQRGRSRAERLRAGGFVVRAGCAGGGRHVVAFDDVCTTGHTLTGGFDALRAAGFVVAGGLVLARTAPGRNQRREAVVVAGGPSIPKEQP
jgi:predicted amidophosphoribosyltransferase